MSQKNFGAPFLSVTALGVAIFGGYHLTLGGTGKVKSGEYKYLAKVYEGDVQDGKREGKGTDFANQVIYEDTVTPNGKVSKVIPSPHYVGEWHNNLRNGKGAIYINGLLEFEGEFKDGLKHGHGKVYNEDGKLVQEGEWRDGYFVLNKEK